MTAESKVKIKTMPAVTVATAGTAVPLSATTVRVYAVSIESADANTGIQYVGDETVTSANGATIKPGEGLELDVPDRCRTDQFDLKDIYVNSSTNGAVIRIIAWIRE